MTDSMKRALEETGRRREIQLEYNERNHIVPQSIVKPIDMSLVAVAEGDYVTVPLEVDEEVEDLHARAADPFHYRASKEIRKSRP